MKPKACTSAYESKYNMFSSVILSSHLQERLQMHNFKCILTTKVSTGPGKPRNPRKIPDLTGPENPKNLDIALKISEKFKLFPTCNVCLDERIIRIEKWYLVK